jgi:hypothetical protein
MARARTTKQVVDLLGQLELPILALELVPMMTSFAGVDYSKNTFQLDNNTAAEVNNLRLSDGFLVECRAGTQAVGSAHGSELLASIVYKDRNGEHIIRVHTTGVQLYAGGSWYAFTGVSMGLSVYSIPSFTTWGEYLVIGCETGVYELNIGARTYTKLANAPGCKHITTFGSRLVLSWIFSSGTEYPRRVQWCVKNDNTDWSGLGSGFEDLLSTPGGITDFQLGCYPVNDREAILVRSGSLWTATLTGQVDAPFEFSFLRGDLPCDAPYSVATIGVNALIYVTRNNVIVASISGKKEVGMQIRSQLLASGNAMRRMVGTFDPHRNEYRLIIPGSGVVWRYNIIKEVWTKDTYPFQIKHTAASVYQRQLSIDELTGTIDSLTGPIDELGLQAITPTVLFTMENANYVVRETEGVLTDVTTAGGSTAIGWQLDTGYVPAPSGLHTVEIHSQHIHLTTPTGITITFSSNDGTGWTTYSTLDTVSDSEPRPYRVRKNIHRKKLRLRISGAASGGMQLIAWLREVAVGYKVNP